LEFWRSYFSHVAAIVTEGQAEHAKGDEYRATTAAGESKEQPASSSPVAAVATAAPVSAATASAGKAAASSSSVRPASSSPVVPASSLSPPPLDDPASAAITVRAVSAVPSASSPSPSPSAPWNRVGLTPQHVVDDGRGLGAAFVAQLAGLHHNMPHDAPHSGSSIWAQVQQPQVGK
jgi:hypothetical protein